MRRTALALPRIQPSPRAARKSEWLRSALAHHHCPDTGAENEIIVLATGIDQYLQEVFHHLAYPNQDDTVSAEDFKALCAVLGLPGQLEEFRDVCSSLPEKLSFKDFHSRLCGYFRVRSTSAVTGVCDWRLPVSEDTELVERQIRLRWPRVRRKCVSFDLSRDQTGTRSRSGKSRTVEHLREQGMYEAAALRELVEDLRCALQGSDARCLALEVSLRRERRQPGGAQDDRPRRGPRRRETRDPLLRELKLIRSSRDGQLEEAMKFSERLEEELQWAYQEVRKLQGMESSLRKENSQIRKRTEEAREALSLGLQRVRLIQEQAQSVPQLESKITELETELLRYRYKRWVWFGDKEFCVWVCFRIQLHIIYAECLQRAVEGRAASDEEEEDQGLKKRGKCCSLEGKSNLLDVTAKVKLVRLLLSSFHAQALLACQTLFLPCVGRPPGLQAADALCIHLTSSDLPKGRGEEDKEEGQSAKKHLLPPSGCQTNNVNSLLISG
uniref:EF-hand and coiled-coil domain containing 1 n=1 Tax=Fundulus heteroclitus TaxID=8078 RepID=A0A3Q2QRC9_FUNHE